MNSSLALSLNGKNEYPSDYSDKSKMYKVSGPILRDIKLNYINRLLLSHLNINSIRNTFELLKHIIKGNMDIMVLTETKIDESFSKQEYYIEGYTSFRDEIETRMEEEYSFMSEDIACREIKSHMPTIGLETVTPEINLSGYNHTKSS